MNDKAMKKIMIVDDEQSILLSLFHALKTDGVEVLTSNEMEQAEAALEITHFDLVIADIRMSGVSGIEGLELLTYIKQRFDTEVIIMTGYGSEEIESEAYRRGALRYFSKPVDVVELLKQVDSIGIPTKNYGSMQKIG